MAIHLFSTPVQCTNCGTLVDDPTVDKCPNCGTLLLERRTPGRLAGVERRYGPLRFLLGFIRFLAVIIVLVGVLMFLGSDESAAWTVRVASMLGSVVLASVLFVVAAVFDLALDMEEHTRATFRVHQQILQVLQTERSRQP
jgi:predicted RNA-binding Zn-ribbon protein involved in translation (DUF1610 family)